MKQHIHNPNQKPPETSAQKAPAAAPPPPASSPAIARRTFLKSGMAGLAAGAVGFPMILSRRVLGGGGETGANERVVLGMIGVGIMGSSHVRGFSNDCSIAAIADAYLPHAERSAKWLREEGHGDSVDAIQDYRRLLERKDIDAVVISTPAHWHALQCIHSAQAGKDVYCEKPLTNSVWEGRKLVEAVEKYKIVLQTGSQQRSGRMEHVGITHVRNGTLGKISRVLAHNYRSPQENGHPGEPVRDGLDWDLWCGPAEKPDYNYAIWTNNQNAEPCWSGVRLFSGGDMADWGAHGVDMIQWALNMDHGGPEEVWVEGEPFVPMISTPENPGGRRGGPQKPKVFMKYPRDITLEFEGADMSGGVFIGEHGSITVSRSNFSSDPEELVTRPLENPADEIHRGFDYARSYNHGQDWLNCIKTRSRPVAHAEAGHRTASVCHLANIARWVSGITGKTGFRLKWDAQAERFTNSDIANQFLKHNARKGYEIGEEV